MLREQIKNKRAFPPFQRKCLFVLIVSLDYSDICRSRTLLTLFYIKGNSIAFIQGLKTF